jgi:hypothetical protein
MIFAFCLAVQAHFIDGSTCTHETTDAAESISMPFGLDAAPMRVSSSACPLPSVQAIVAAEASSEANRYSLARKAIDGDINPSRSTGNLWITARGEQSGAWIEFEFEGEVAVHTIRLFQMGNDRRNSEIRSFTVITDLADQATGTVASGQGWQDIHLSTPVVGSRMRVVVDQVFDHGESRVSLKEIEFLGCEERL